MIVDTHAHLTNEHLVDQLDDFLSKAGEVDVTAMLCVGTNAEDSRKGVELAEKYDSIRAAVGIHPNVCCEAGPDDWAGIEKLCRHPRVAALGETGLDKYWDDCPWDLQVDYFCRHLQLSRETGLPVVIHTRDCAQETLEVLQEQSKLGPLKAVMHSFTGPQSVADGCLELGLYISFAGMVTFKNGLDNLNIAQRIPADRILVETDSPYLTPHPKRGKRPNHPAMVRYTLEHIAAARDVPAKELAEQTTQNAFELFGAW